MIGKNFLRHSLGHRITLATLVIFVAGIWVLSYYASQILREDIERLLADQQFSTVSFVADEIDYGIKDRILAVERIAGLIEQPQLDNPAALQKMLESRPIFLDIFNAGAFAVARDGTCIADVSRVVRRIGANFFDDDAIHAALVEGKSTVGRPMMGKMQHQPMFTIAVPIRDARGMVVGALAGVTNLINNSFLDAIWKHRYGKSGGYLVIDPQHGVFVTATDKSRVLQPLPAPGINRMHDKYMQGYEGSGITVNSLGVEELTSAKHIPVSGWLVVATLPTEEAFSPIRDMQRRIMFAAIFLTLAVGMLSWRLLKHQLSPLLSAVEKLAAMSTGQPLQPLPVAKHDEIGMLVGGFNRLLGIIAEREAQIVAERDFFSALLRQSSDGVFLFNPDSLAILEANTSLCEMLGYRRDEMLALKLTDLAQAPADDVRAKVRAQMEGSRPFIAERNYLRKDGTLVTAEVHSSVVVAGGRRLIMANIRDITERKNMSDKLLRLNLLYAVLSKTNEAIIHMPDETTLLKRLCHIAVEQGGFRMAWAGWINEETGCVQPQVHAGHEDGYLAQITIKTGDDKFSLGPTGSSIKNGHTAICNDIRNDPHMAPWRDQAVARGYLSSASVPFEQSGEVVGAFAVYAAAPGFFDTGVAQLLEEIGQNVSFALDHMINEKARAEAEQELRISQRRLNDIMQALGDGILVSDRDGNLVTMNAEAERLLGWRAHEIVGHPIHPLIHGHKADGSPFHEKESPILAVCRTMQAYRSESEVFVRSDGSDFPVSYVAAPFDVYGEAASVTVFRDISARKKADEDLKASRQELRELSDFLESVREDERTRIARELHDELGQMLTALKIDLCWIEGKLAGGERKICTKLVAMEKMLDQTVDSVRRISTDLRPWILDDLGLGAAIEWLVERFEQQNDIICEAQIADEEALALDPSLSTSIFRIVQEALTNITRHAEASRVQVEILRQDDEIAVWVRDNGKGFELEATLKKKRLGLLGIRERVDKLGGRLDVLSSPGTGTMLHVRLPYKLGFLS